MIMLKVVSGGALRLSDSFILKHVAFVPPMGYNLLLVLQMLHEGI